MAGPWQKYQPQGSSGPWGKYGNTRPSLRDQIAANPPGVPRPVPPELLSGMTLTDRGAMPYREAVAAGPNVPTGQAEQAMGFGIPARESLKEAMRAPAIGAATVAPMLTGGASLPVQMAVGGVSGAAQSKLLGGDDEDVVTSGVIGATLPAVGPALNSRVGRSLVAGTKAAAGRIPFVGPPIRAGLRAAMAEWNPVPVERAITRQMVPEYAGELEGETSEALTARPPRLIQQMGGKPVETITEKPTGRLVLTPEQAQSEARQMTLAKKMASQRGMQYAAGMQPTQPGTQ